MPTRDWKIVVEYDGEEHHTSPEDRAHDERRRDWLRRRGWIVIVVTKEDFRRTSSGDWLVELRAALDERMPRTRKPSLRARRASGAPYVLSQRRTGRPATQERHGSTRKNTHGSARQNSHLGAQFHALRRDWEME